MPKPNEIVERGALADKLRRDLATATNPEVIRYIKNSQRWLRRRSPRVNARAGGLGRK